MAIARQNTIKYGIDNMRGNVLKNVGDPVGDRDSANKQYVDDSIATALSQISSISFAANKSTGGDYSATGVVVFDSVLFNNGSAYNASTGKFTAPQDGYYHFSFTGYTNNTTGRAQFWKNSYQYVTSENAGKTLSCDVYLATGETFYCSGTPTFPMNMYGAGGHNLFSGHLIGGPKGDTGAKGDKGDTGAKGDKGDTGPQGVAGSDNLTLADIYPVGCIYMTTVSTNPATVFGFGTWSAWGSGRVPVGVDTGQTEFDTVEETGGAKTHTLSEAEMPIHTHGILGWLTNVLSGGIDRPIIYGKTAGSTEITTYTNTQGGGQAHNNLQPYITCYMFKRTA